MPPHGDMIEPFTRLYIDRLEPPTGTNSTYIHLSHMNPCVEQGIRRCHPLPRTPKSRSGMGSPNAWIWPPAEKRQWWEGSCLPN
uniref:Uncharacterized protein n=1 Tax=Picea glauca TaxID=3330 RepID=A0A101M555_PICGL|nr:hypothetical protein ABT39_MTgene861 [Picea glauca]